MNDKELKDRCGCWSVPLPDREPDFSGACARCEACDCACRNRCLGTIALLLVFVVAGATIGLVGARRQDSANLAALRELHLNQVAPGGSE